MKLTSYLVLEFDYLGIERTNGIVVNVIEQIDWNELNELNGMNAFGLLFELIICSLHFLGAYSGCLNESRGDKNIVTIHLFTFNTIHLSI